MATLQGGGTLQVQINDAGTPTSYNLHLNGSGNTLTDGTNNFAITNNAGVYSISLTNALPGNGNSISISATTTDQYGNVSVSSNIAQATQETNSPDAPTVSFTQATGSPSVLNAAGETTTTAVVNISSADATLLASGGVLTIGGTGATALTLHVAGTDVLNASGNSVGTLVAGTGGTYNLNLTENIPAGGAGTLQVIATVTDAYGNASSGNNSTNVYSAGPETAPVVSILGATASPGSLFNDGVIPTPVTAPVTLNVSAADATILANGGTLTINSTGSAAQILTVSGANVLSGATVVGSVSSGSGGTEIITLNAETVPPAGSNWVVTAQITDAYNNSITGTTSTYVYAPITSQPYVAIPSAINGQLSTATTGATVNATVTLDAAGIASLNTGGSVQITVADPAAGATQYLNLHLNGLGQLVDGSGTTYTYNGSVITLSETAPGSGNTLTVTATETDAGGVVSASSTAAASEYTPISAIAPTVSITGAVANTLTNAIMNGATAVNATVAFNAAQQNTLASGGTVHVTIVDAGVTQNLNLVQVGNALVDSLGHTYTYAGGIATFAEVAPGTGNAITVSASLTDAAGVSSPTGTASATETITPPDTPTVALLANGLVGNYYGVTETAISTPPGTYTALEEVDAYLLAKTTATSTISPTTFPTAVIAPATASFIATQINYGLNTASTSPTTGNETISGNLGTSGKLATFLDGFATNATNFQTLSGYGTTNQAIITMTGVVALPTLGSGQEYALKIFADDGYQVYVDGQLVSTVPANQSGKADFFYFTAPATAGNLHSIQILYWDQGGQASFQASVGTTLTANQPGNSSTAPTLITPLSILSASIAGQVTATVTLDSNNQTTLTNGGTVLITESNGTNLVLHQNAAGHMVDAGGLIYTYVNGVIYIPVATSSTTASISATVVDQYTYHSTTAYTGPSISIASDSNHDGYLNSSEVAGETANHVLANVNLNTSMLTSSGSATITVLDAGVTTTLTVSAAGVISGTTANVAATYSAGVVAITLPNPGNGNSATISATQTDQYGHVSTTATSTVIENITAAPAAPTVSISTDTNHDGYLSAQELNGGNVNAAITLNSAAQTTLTNGGSVQIYVTDNGTTETLNLHLNAGVLVNAAGVSSPEYSYAAGVITLTEPAPGNGHSISVSATTADIAGNVSANSSTATAVQNALDSPLVMALDPQHATVTLSAASQTVLATSGSTLTVTASDGTSLSLHENAGGQLVDAGNVVHSFTNGILPVTLNSSTSAPVTTVSSTLTDSHGVSSLTSSATLVHSGSNSLTELAGGDTFVFALSANGTPGTAQTQTISAFNGNAPTGGGDVLNLADLLSGVAPSVLASSPSNYLHFTEANVSGVNVTTLHVSSTGGYSGGFSSALDTMQIALNNTDLLQSGSLTSSQLIQNLLTQHKLVE